MNNPANLKYAASHEWARQEADGNITIGITDHAQEALGDLVFVELPEVGAHFDAEKEIAVVESVKAAADVYAPIAGTVTEVNQAAADAPDHRALGGGCRRVPRLPRALRIGDAGARVGDCDANSFGKEAGRERNLPA